jgi:hypothetical protein
MGQRETAILLSLLFAASIHAAGPVQGTRIHKSSGTKIGTDAARDAKVQSDAFGNYKPYHNGTTLLCSDCHVMHASEQHAYDGTTAPDFPRSNTPYNTLLRKADSVDVCLSCHDGRLGVPDVVGNDSNSLTERSAGFFDLPDSPNHKGHNLGRGVVVDPSQYCNRCHFVGEFATAEVTCIDCHNPHGNDRVRNLQWVSAPGSEPQFAMLMRTGATGLAKYERANVAYAYVAGQAREVTNMCIDCHHTFFGDSGGWYTNPDGDDHWNRHPNFNSEWGSVQAISGLSADPQHWTDGTGSGFDGAPRVPFVGIGATDFVSAMTVDPATNGVFCLSCHKAHGSDNAFAMTFDPQVVPKAKGCDQCHASQEP